MWSEVTQSIEVGEYDFMFADPLLKRDSITDKKTDIRVTATHLRHASEVLSNISVWDAVSLKNALWDYASEHGRSSVLWPLRYVLTGKEKSPDPFAVASIIGKDATLRRIQGALSLLSNV